MPQLGTKGAELDLLIRQGATLGPFSMQVKTADGGNIDITDAIFRAEIRKTPESPSIAGVTFAFAIVNAAEGRMTWELPADSSTILSAGDTETESESLYVWDMEMELTSGRVFPLLYGKVSVFREVTKEN